MRAGEPKRDGDIAGETKRDGDASRDVKRRKGDSLRGGDALGGGPWRKGSEFPTNLLANKGEWRKPAGEKSRAGPFESFASNNGKPSSIDCQALPGQPPPRIDPVASGDADRKPLWVGDSVGNSDAW